MLNNMIQRHDQTLLQLQTISIEWILTVNKER